MKKLLMCGFAAFSFATAVQAAEQLPCQKLIPRLLDSCSSEFARRGRGYSCTLRLHDATSQTFTLIQLSQAKETDKNGALNGEFKYSLAITLKDGGIAHDDDADGYAELTSKQNENDSYSRIQNAYQKECALVQQQYDNGVKAGQ